MKTSIVMDLSGLCFAKRDDSHWVTLYSSDQRQAAITLGMLNEFNALKLCEAINREVARDRYPVPGLSRSRIMVSLPSMRVANHWADNIDTLEIVYQNRFQPDDGAFVLLHGIGADLVADMVEAITAEMPARMTREMLADLTSDAVERTPRRTGRLTLSDELARKTSAQAPYDAGPPMLTMEKASEIMDKAQRRLHTGRDDEA